MNKEATIALIVLAVLAAGTNIVLFDQVRHQQNFQLDKTSQLEKIRSRTRAQREEFERLTQAVSESSMFSRQLRKLVEAYQRYDLELPDDAFHQDFQHGFFCRSGVDKFYINIWLPKNRQIRIKASHRIKENSKDIPADVIAATKEFVFDTPGWHTILCHINDSDKSIVELVADRRQVFAARIADHSSIEASPGAGANQGPIWPLHRNRSWLWTSDLMISTSLWGTEVINEAGQEEYHQFALTFSSDTPQR